MEEVGRLFVCGQWLSGMCGEERRGAYTRRARFVDTCWKKMVPRGVERDVEVRILKRLRRLRLSASRPSWFPGNLLGIASKRGNCCVCLGCG